MSRFNTSWTDPVGTALAELLAAIVGDAESKAEKVRGEAAGIVKDISEDQSTVNELLGKVGEFA